MSERDKDYDILEEASLTAYRADLVEQEFSGLGRIASEPKHLHTNPKARYDARRISREINVFLGRARINPEEYKKPQSLAERLRKNRTAARLLDIKSGIVDRLNGKMPNFKTAREEMEYFEAEIASINKWKNRVYGAGGALVFTSGIYYLPQNNIQMALIGAAFGGVAIGWTKFICDRAEKVYGRTLKEVQEELSEE